jgi:hypothetical protein
LLQRGGTAEVNKAGQSGRPKNSAKSPRSPLPLIALRKVDVIVAVTLGSPSVRPTESLLFSSCVRFQGQSGHSPQWLSQPSRGASRSSATVRRVAAEPMWCLFGRARVFCLIGVTTRRLEERNSFLCDLDGDASRRVASRVRCAELS